MNLKEKLSQAGLKATPQRMLILEHLMETDAHPTADKLYEKLQIIQPTISLATVHKTLETLTEHGLATKILTKEGCYRYDGKTDQHHHVLIENSNEIIDFHDPNLQKIIEDYLNLNKIENFKLSNISLNISGTKINESKTIQFKH
jgi:Fur family peroxide stress response transcriptional regulator